MDATPASFDLELLTEHSDWVRALARSLVRDPGAADDIAQDTWVAALRRPPDANRPARAWLGAVARNVARQHVRARDRRARRERGAARAEALPSDEQLAERVALQQWVVEQVMTLDEPYRRTILLRYFEGLAPREIALRMDVPLETVKTRSKRALARLRERLGSERGPGGANGVSALIPLVASIPSSVATGAGLVLMGKKSLLFVAALVLLLVSGALYMALWATNGAPVPEGIVGLNGAENAAALERSARAVLDPAGPVEIGGMEERTPLAVETRSIVLRTIERDSGSPVAGAQVWFAPWSAVRERSLDAGRGESFDIEAALPAFGRSARSDEHGEVNLANLEGLTVAIARSGELFGQVSFLPKASAAGVDVPLAVDRSITIQTVTEAGEPVSGIPVGLAKGDPQGWGDLFWWAPTTGTAGQVTVHHVDHTLERDFKPGGTWTATLASPWPSPPAVHIDPRDLPGAPIRLVVGSGGRVVVRVEDEQGELHGGHWVHITQVRENRDAVGRMVRPRRHGIFARSGLAVFENVAPGLELRVATSPPTHRPIEKVVTSPAQPGDELVVSLRLGERYPTLSGVLVDAAGSVIAGRQMDARVSVGEPAGDARDISARFRTDDEGRFETSLRTRSLGSIPREVVLTTDESYEGAALSARVVLKEHRTDRDIDLGRVTLEPPPVILTGRVVDSDGEPIFWAGIWVKRMSGTNGIGGPPYEWVHPWQTNTQKDGSFQLTGDQGVGDFRLRVAQPGYSEQNDIPFQPGTRDLEVVLRKSGGLEGRLKLPGDVPPSWLRATVKWDAARRGFEQESVRPNPDGSFFLLDLAPGEVDVTVFLPAWPEPLARIANVGVDGDGTRADPRLELDLTDAIHRIDLDVRDADGDAIPIGCVAFAHPDGGWSRTAFTGGTVALLARAPTVDAEIIAPGFRPQRIDGARDGLRVVLERGIGVRVKLPEDFELPDPRATLSVELLPTGMTGLDDEDFVYADDGTTSTRWGRGQYGVTAILTDTREVTLDVGSPGRWQVAWSLRSERATGGVRGAAGYPDSIEVGASGTAGVIELAPDAEEVERWISRFD